MSEGSVSLLGDWSACSDVRRTALPYVFFRKPEVTATPDETDGQGNVAGINGNGYFADLPYVFPSGTMLDIADSYDASAPCSRLVR